MRRVTIVAKAVAAVWIVCLSCSCGAVTQALNSPGQINNATTITFEGYSHETVANDLYQNQGVTFSRDDGYPVFIYNWSDIGRTTISPTNVLATVLVPGLSPTWAPQLNVLSSSPLYAIGAYFGNDSDSSDFAFERLSVYGPSGQLLGAVQVAANNNTSDDQFIGIQSDVPFTSARFENLNPSGSPSVYYAVDIDNLSLAVVPEPASFSILVIGMPVGLFLRKRRR